MSRKDFQLIAGALKASKPSANSTKISDTPNAFDLGVNTGSVITWSATCTNMADALATSNAHFDRVRFLTACGYNEA